MLYFDEVAALREQLGECLHGKAYAEAFSLAQRLVSLHKHHKNTKNIGYADDVFTLARVLRCLHKYADARPLLEEAALLTAELTGRGPLLADRLTSLAVCHARMNAHADAICAFGEAHAIRLQALGEEHPETAHALYNLANAHLGGGRLDDALRCHRLAYARRKREPNDAADSLLCMAHVYEAKKEYAQAEDMAAKALRQRKRAVGEDASAYIVETQYRAQLCDEAELFDKSARLYGLAARLIRRNGTEEHPHYAVMLNAMADAHIRLGDFPRAIGLRMRALRLLRAGMGDMHMVCASSMRVLSFLLHKEGKTARAAHMMAESLRVREALTGMSEFEYIRDVMWLCGLHMEMKRFDHALALLKKTMDTAREKGEDKAFHQIGELLKVYLLLGEIGRLQTAGEGETGEALLQFLQKFYQDTE